MNMQRIGYLPEIVLIGIHAEIMKWCILNGAARMYFSRVDENKLVIFSCISFAIAIKFIGAIHHELDYIVIMEMPAKTVMR